jgi:hypothetical protein
MSRWNRGLKTLAVTGSLWMLAGCGAVLGPRGQLEELRNNRQRWEAVRAEDYVYAVRALCFCGEATLGAVRVTVSGDEVVSRTVVETDEPVDPIFGETIPSVDGLFDVLEDAYERDAFSVEVTYHASLGIPIDIAIDYIELAIDEELGYAVTELPGPPPA